MAGEVNQVPQPTMGEKLIGGAINGGFKALNTGMKIMSLPEKRQNSANATNKIVSDTLNSARNNQYHQKLSAEENTDSEKTKKKRNFGKYVPALAGAMLLASAGGSIIKSGDVTKPIQDMRDGVKRVPAAALNKLTKIKPLFKKGAKEVRKGAQEGIKQSGNAVKPAINKGLLSEYALGAMKGAGYFSAYLAGSEYLKHRAAKGDKKQQELLDSYRAGQPKSRAVEAVGKAGADVAKAVAEYKRKEAQKDDKE